MVAFDSVVSILSVDMRDVVKMRIISVIYVAYDLAISRCVSPLRVRISGPNERQLNDQHRRRVGPKDPRHLGKTADIADTSAQRTK